jgi:hypothetical protein
MVSKMSCRKFNNLFVVGLLAILAVGCISTAKEQRLPTSGISTTQMQHLETEQEMPTPTPSPGGTDVPPSSTPMNHQPLSTPQLSATAEVLPTLAPEAASGRLQDLLRTNGDCRLPCFWDIQVGESRFQQVREVLEPMQSISTFAAFSENIGKIYLDDSDGDFRFLTDISFLAGSDQLLNLLTFHARAVVDDPETQGIISIYDLNGFSERIKPYTISGLLKELGKPASVQLFTFGEVPSHRYGQGHFKVLILYPQQGILARYTTEMKVVDGLVEGCLPAAHVEMVFLPPGDETTFFDILARKTNWSQSIDYYSHLEDVTELTLEEFRSTFSSSKEACLYTPANLWSVAER